MIRYRLVLASGKVETVENPILIDIGTSGVLVIYDQTNAIVRAIAPGQWHTFDRIEDDDPTPDVYSDATKAAVGA